MTHPTTQKFKDADTLVKERLSSFIRSTVNEAGMLGCDADIVHPVMAHALCRAAGEIIAQCGSSKMRDAVFHGALADFHVGIALHVNLKDSDGE